MSINHAKHILCIGENQLNIDPRFDVNQASIKYETEYPYSYLEVLIMLCSPYNPLWGILGAG